MSTLLATIIETLYTDLEALATAVPEILALGTLSGAFQVRYLIWI